MPVTIQAILDSEEGPQIGLRIYTLAEPEAKVGADRILTQDSSRTNLYSLSTTLAAGDYTVDVYAVSFGAIVGGSFSGGYLSIRADGGTYTVAEISEQLIRDAVGLESPNLGEHLEGIIKDGEPRTLSRDGKEPITFVESRPV